MQLSIPCPDRLYKKTKLGLIKFQNGWQHFFFTIFSNFFSRFCCVFFFSIIQFMYILFIWKHYIACIVQSHFHIHMIFGLINDEPYTSLFAILITLIHIYWFMYEYQVYYIHILFLFKRSLKLLSGCFLTWATFKRALYEVLHDYRCEKTVNYYSFTFVLFQFQFGCLTFTSWGIEPKVNTLLRKELCSVRKVIFFAIS